MLISSLAGDASDIGDEIAIVVYICYESNGVHRTIFSVMVT